MPMETGKPQIAQNASVFAAADGEGIWNIEIGDSDFRTYVLLCQAAWQEQPQAEAPFTERNFAELARLHPARQRPTAQTVRGRIYRLTKAGLIRRERSGRTAWRTYPLVDGLSMPKTQPNARKQGAQLAAMEPVTSQLAARKLATSSCPSDLTARQARAQDRQLAASKLGTSGSVEILTARQEHTQDEQLAASSLATSTSAQDLTARQARAQDPQLADSSSLTTSGFDQIVSARGEHTQNEALSASSLAPSTCPQDMTARQEHTHDEPLATNRATAPAFRSLALLHRNGTNPRKIVRRSVEMPEAPDAEAPKQKAIVYSLSEIAHILPANLRRAQIDGSVSARQEHTQEQQLATSGSEQAVTARQTRAQEQIEPTNARGARQEHSQDEPLAASTSAQVKTARSEHTQDEPLVTSNLAASDSNQAVTARGARAQNEPLAPGASPSRTRTRERASVLSGSDLPSSETTPKPGGSSETDSTGDTNARAKGPRPPVLERVQVPEGFEDLAVQLANLRPQGMNFEGIAECLKNPELTRAWTEHALSTKEVIRNVPAYIRAGVRSGKLPVTDAEKEALQAERRTNPAALAATDYGRDDPALKDWDVSDIFRKPGPSKGKDKYGWGDPDETPPDPYGGPYVH